MITIVLFVAAVPLTVSAFMALREHQRAFDQQTALLHRRTADAGASLIRSYLDEVTRALTLLASETISWDELDPDERNHALWLVYRQFDDLVVASLLDENGDGVGPSAFVDSARPLPELASHPTVTRADLDRFASRVPLDRALAERSAMGEPFLASNGEPTLPLAFRVNGTGDPAHRIIAVGLSLRSTCRHLLGETIGKLRVELLDSSGRVLCSADRPPLQPGPRPVISAGIPSPAAYHDRAGDFVVASRGSLPAGWSVVARQPVATAFAASGNLRRHSVFWIGVSVVVALVAGLFLADGIIRPVKRLAAAAAELGGGRFDHRVAIRERDELGALADAFNRMGSEIQRRDAEIRRWNDELQGRVDQRTHELRDAHQQLLESQKIAAVATLGAGFAHEINNPLAAVLGLTQVLLADVRGDEERPRAARMLVTIEREAQRIRSIVERVHGLVESNTRAYQALDVNQLLDVALRLGRDRWGAGCEVVREYDPAVPPVMGDAHRLQQAFFQIIDNAVQAMNGAGVLTLSISAIDGQLAKIEIRDTGKGIAPEDLGKIFEPFFTTKQNWRGQGLGLSVAYQTISAHQGKIKATSQVGRGTTMTITLPVARRGAHLT